MSNDLRGALLQAHLITPEQIELADAAAKREKVKEREKREKDERASRIIKKVLHGARRMGTTGLPRNRHNFIHGWLRWYLDGRLPADCDECCFICGEKKMSVKTALDRIARATDKLEVAEAIVDSFRPKTVKKFPFEALLAMYFPEYDLRNQVKPFFAKASPGMCDTCRPLTTILVQEVMTSGAPASEQPPESPR